MGDNGQRLATTGNHGQREHAALSPPTPTSGRVFWPNRIKLRSENGSGGAGHSCKP